MVVFYYFLTIGTSIVFMILYFDKKQRTRVRRISKEVSNVQPLFLLRSSDQKLAAIKTMLYGHMAGATISGQVNMNKGARQLIASELDKLVSSYKYNEINLQIYHQELTDLHKMVYKVKDMSFEQVN